MTKSSEALRSKGMDPKDWRSGASRDELLSMIDREKDMCASMARTMSAALDRLAENRAVLVQVAQHDATRGHPLYGAMVEAAHQSLPHVLGRQLRASDERANLLSQVFKTALQGVKS